MLDLNLDLSLLKGSTCDDTDSNPNADDGEFIEDNAVAGEGDDSGISNVSSDVITAAVDGSDCTTFKFSILDKSRNDGDVIIIEDDYDCGQPGLKTRQLFPVAEVEEISSFPLNTRPRHWLNLAVPEAVGATEASGSRTFGVAGKHVTQLPKSPPQTGKKSRRGPRSRSSQYRGVTFYRRTGRWESHIWDCRKQVYLGGFDTSYAAARAYDRAAIKFRGVNADINFHISDYEKDIQQMKNLTKEEFIQVLRPRQNGGISRSSSKYKCGEAQINHFKGAFEISNLEGDAILSFEHNTIGKNAVQFFNEEDRGRSLDLNLWDSEPLIGKRLKILDTSTSTQENSTSHNYTSTWNNKQKEEIRDSKPWLIRSNSQTGHGNFNMTRFPQFLSVLRQHHQDSNPQISPMNTRNMVRYPPLALQKP